MSTHISILPADVLDTISMKLNENESASRTQFLRLPHPRTGIPSLFLPYRSSKTGRATQWEILEVQRVSPPNPRSWFFSDDEVVEDGKLLVMTPIDPSFILIPILQASKPLDGSLGTFRPIDDILDDVAPRLSQLSSSSDPSSTTVPKDILFLSSLDCIAGAMRRICDVKDITPEITVYRYSEEKVMKYLHAKVARLSKSEVSELSRTVVRNLAKDDLMEDGKEILLELGRVKAACDLVSQFISRDTYKALLANYDFSALDAHLKALQDEAAALALANAPIVKAKKTNAGGEDEKKRKAKAKGSQGVEKLKKTNVNGMAKISSFFQKK
ncbi:hypothetical protein EW146_g201 [Bondarzewia mesenterica]|uniref:Ribonuclease H2 subunit B n=1 Tax=Bondarzewia mesenterica TaxID=1095465 RepID=A0A4S4ME24_9AGAM|nr:hypothetical protein EW146_g201 [Bondarzewia mesenterica]